MNVTAHPTDEQMVGGAVGPGVNTPAGVAWWAPHGDPYTGSKEENHGRTEGRAAFAGVIVFTIILLLSPQNLIPALAPLRIAFVTAGAATAFLVRDRWQARKPLLQLNREVLVAAALLAWAAVTVPLSYWPGGSAGIVSNTYFKALVIFWLLANVITTMERLRYVAITLILCALPLAATAVKNFVTGKFFSAGDPTFERIVGYQNALASNPNDMALMLNLLIPLSIAVCLSTTRPGLRVFYLLAIAFSVAGVILTFSRAGFLGLVTIGGVYFVRLVRRPGRERAWAFGLLLIAALSLPFLPSRYTNRIATITDIKADKTGSSQARWRDNVAAMHFIMRHPIIGAGIGMDALALNEVRGPWWSQVHNVYFQYGVDLGLPGLTLFLTLLWGVFRAARRSRVNLASIPALRHSFLLVEGVEITLILFAVAGLFHPVAYHFYFYYMAGLALAARSATAAAISTTKGLRQEREHFNERVVPSRYEVPRAIPT